MMNTRYTLTTPDITDIIVDSRILIQYLKGVFFGSAKPVTLGRRPWKVIEMARGLDYHWECQHEPTEGD